MNMQAARWALTTGALPLPRFVLLTLATHANRDGLAWPSVPTLVEETGLAERTVQRSLSVLETDGLVDVERVAGRGNRYRLPYTDPRHSDTPVTQSPPSQTTLTPVTQSKTPATVTGEGLEGLLREQRARARAANSNNGSATFLPGSGWIEPVAHEQHDDVVADPKRALRGARKAITRARRQTRSTETD